MIDYPPSDIVDIIIEYEKSNKNARECAHNIDIYIHIDQAFNL